MRVLSPEVVAPSGYTLIDQLGSGGFGEVWKATAPGGVEKAVKIVFGHFEEELAARELKSLERVRDVRHPFLLSVERFEIVNNRLAIVTELADSSLDKRFKECRRDGLPGIPRDELLVYLADAAEALDCLSERHGLQHLDVKPENLLVVGEHVKVADFGLVKELGARTLNSMVGGMTPLYSPPEVYDDAPSLHSDQYSLAIVYQQMLTGVLPFSGRTPAQLAKQHTMMRPNVSVLSESDQAAVLKALAKSPEDRFGNSRQFVAALKDGKGVPAPTPTTPSQNDDPAPGDTKSILAISTTPMGATSPGDPAPLVAPRPQPRRVDRRFKAVDGAVQDIRFPESLAELPANTSPTLVVAAGGLGGEMLSAFATQRGEPDAAAPPIEWLAIDTDRADLRDRMRSLEDVVDREDFLHLPLHRPKHYAGSSERLLNWLSRRWLYNIPRSLATRGYRPLGRLALIDNAAVAYQALEAKLRGLAATCEDDRRIHVVLLSSVSGGTGSGVAIDTAQAVRAIGAELGVTTSISGVFATTLGREKADTEALAAGNTIAFLTELAHAQQDGNKGTAPHEHDATPFLGEGRPFDALYTVPFGKRRGRDRTLASVAAFLDLRARADLESVFDSDAISGAGADQGDAAMRVFAAVRPAEVIANDRAVFGEIVRDVLAREWTRPALPSEVGPASAFTRGLGDQRDCRLAQAVAQEIPPPPPPVETDADNPNPQPVEPAPPTPDAKAVAAFLERCGELLGTRSSPDEHPVDGELIEGVTRALVARIRNVDTPVTADGLWDLFDQLVDNAAESAPTGAVEQLGPLLETNQLECGHTRGRLIVSASETDRSTYGEAFPEARPVSGGGPKTVLVTLGAGVDLRDLAARTAEGVEGVGDAAGRLHARQDVAWEDLRDIIGEG